MRPQFFIVLAIVAGAYALPRASDVVFVADPAELSGPIQRNFIEDVIRNHIELISTLIRRLGLDPVEVERRDIEITPVFLNLIVKAFVENLKFNGASDIQIHALNYNRIFNRLRLDISLPEISLTIGDSGLEALFVNEKFEGQLKGSLTIKSIRLASEINLNISLEGISLRSLSVDFSLGGIESDLTLVVQRKDISENINIFLGDKIPSYVENNRDEINGRLEEIIEQTLIRIWG